MEQKELEPRMYLVHVCIISFKDKAVLNCWNYFDVLGFPLSDQIYFSEYEINAQLTKLWQNQTTTNFLFKEVFLIKTVKYSFKYSKRQTWSQFLSQQMD